MRKRRIIIASVLALLLAGVLSLLWIARTEVTNEQYERFYPEHNRDEISKGDNRSFLPSASRIDPRNLMYGPDVTGYVTAGGLGVYIWARDSR